MYTTFKLSISLFYSSSSVIKLVLIGYEKDRHGSTRIYLVVCSQLYVHVCNVEERSPFHDT